MGTLRETASVFGRRAVSKCGVCAAGFIMAGPNRLGCFGAGEKTTCENRLTIRLDEARREF